MLVCLFYYINVFEFLFYFLFDGSDGGYTSQSFKVVLTEQENVKINDKQNITQEAKVQATRTPLKTGGELGCSGSTFSLH